MPVIFWAFTPLFPYRYLFHLNPVYVSHSSDIIQRLVTELPTNKNYHAQLGSATVNVKDVWGGGLENLRKLCFIVAVFGNYTKNRTAGLSSAGAP